MKRSSNWDEKTIEKQLKEMPKIEDKQSKEALFERIQERLQEDEVKVRKKKSWFIPAVASAVVLFLLLLLVPAFLNEQESTLDDVLEMEDEANLMMEINDYPEGSPDVTTTEEAPGIKTTDGINDVYYLGAAQPIDELEFAGELVTITVAANYPTGELVIPVTVLSDGASKLGRFMVAKDNFSGERWGIGSFPPIEINSITEETGMVVVIDVPQNSLESMSSAESVTYSLALKETFSKLGYEEIQFTSNGEQGVFWGQHGPLYTMELQEPNRGYYVFKSNTGHHFLVSGRTVGAPARIGESQYASLLETLEFMKQGDESKGYSSSIPDAVVITNVEKTDDVVTITIDESSIDGYREEYLIMVEAIMFAAADFDVRYVQFEGLDELYQIGPYQVNELIEIPKYINFIR